MLLTFNNFSEFHNYNVYPGVPMAPKGGHVQWISNDSPNSNIPTLIPKKPKELRQFTDHNWGYDFNSQGYRSDEFSKERQEFLFAGCSHTFGEGVPVEYTWPYRFLRLYEIKNGLTEKSLNYYNVGYYGASTQGIIHNIICSLKNHSYKNVLCLFPSYHRVLQFVNNDNGTMTAMDMYPSQKLSFKQHGIDIEAFFKGVPDSYLIHQTLLSIMMVKLICEQHNTKFYWATWDKEIADLIGTSTEANDLTESFVSLTPGISGIYDSHMSARDGLHPPRGFYEDTAISFLSRFNTENE